MSNSSNKISKLSKLSESIRRAIRYYLIARKIIKNPLFILISRNKVVKIPKRMSTDALKIRTIQFRDGFTLKLSTFTGHLTDVFFDEVYEPLNVMQEIVIDIGANIGDSTIYFIQKGAKIVIAIEPYPDFYNLLAENIKINNLDNKVIPLNVGISSTIGQIKINKTNTADIGYSLKKCDDGKLIVGLTTLKQILDEFNLCDVVLKMDCEGCEYDSILACEKEILRKFKRVALEYHNGPQNIPEKFEEAGFIVNIPAYTSPIGMLYASRKDM